MLRSLHERGEIELAKIRSHCSRRRAWFSSPVLGWLNYRQPIWHQISLWDFCDQYHSLPDHWLFIGFPGEACRAQRRVEVPNSDRLCWSLQYILDLRMGDLFQFADGCLLRGCPLRCFELLPWPGSCMVWSLDREAFLMRAHKVLNYESILQVLGEGGCPFCRFMKNFQTALLQEPKGEVHHLCNFHTWGLAATQQAVSAAEHFMSLLREQSGVVPGFSCTICTLLQEEEDLRIREFISYSEHKLVAQWLRSQASAWATERSSNTVRHRSFSPRSTPSWKGVDDNSCKISHVCTVNTSQMPRGGEFWDAQRNLWFHSVDFTHKRGETCYLPERL